MSKKKKKSFSKQKHSGKVSKGDHRKQGMQFFQSGNYEKAIAEWSSGISLDEATTEALAEAHFRNAVHSDDPQEQITHMQDATKLLPNDSHFHYQLGLAYHRAGKSADAISIYNQVLQRNPSWAHVGFVLVLAKLEQDHTADLKSLSGISETVRNEVVALQRLLHGDMPTQDKDSSSTPQRFWYALGALQSDDLETATEIFASDESLPSPMANGLRRYYRGVIALRQDDKETTIKHWMRAYEQGVKTQRFLDNLTVVLYQYFQERIESGDLEQAIVIARKVQTYAISNIALSETIIYVLDYAARQAAQEGNWHEATIIWNNCRQMMSGSAKLGSPRLLLHNLALGYETQERWEEAADMWRALLRTRPAQSPESPNKAEGLLSDEQWAWVRNRVIHCYKLANLPEEAVKVFRQAVKKDPNDVDTRLQLSDALIANDQEQAAINQLQRIVEIDYDHVEAHLRLASIYSRYNYWEHQAENELQIVLRLQPEREDVRREMARLMIQRGDHYFHMGLFDLAEKVYREGQELIPNEPFFPINLARLLIDRKKTQEGIELIDQVLETWVDQENVYIYAIEALLVVSTPEKIRAILQQAQQNMTTIAPDFYLDIAHMILSAARPALRANIFGSPIQPQGRVSEEVWFPVAIEIIERVVALQPNNAELMGDITRMLLSTYSDLVLPYAEKAFELDSENVQSQIDLGLALAFNDRASEGKKLLTQTIRIARQKGDMETQKTAEALRSMLDDPNLRQSMQLSFALQDMGINPMAGMDMDMDFDMDEFF